MCALGLLFYFYEYFLRVAPSVMSLELRETFLLNEASLGHLVAFYYYAYTPMQLPVGILMDRFGPRRILTFACLLCVVGASFFSLTKGLHWAQFGRFLMGFGSAFAYIGVLKIATLWLHEKHFGLVAGICTTLGMFGAVVGEILSAKLVLWMGWRAAIVYAMLAGIPLSILLALCLKDKPDADGGGEQSKQSESIRNAIQQLVTMVRRPVMWINGLIGCLLFLPVTAFAEMWAVPYLEATGLSKSIAATAASMVFVGFAVGAPLWGFLSGRFKTRGRILRAGAFVSAACLGVALWNPQLPVYGVCLILFICGAAASVQVLVFSVSNGLNELSASATAAAFTNMVVMLGGMVMQPSIGKLLDCLGASTSMPSATHYAWSLAVLPVGLLLAGFLSRYVDEPSKAVCL